MKGHLRAGFAYKGRSAKEYDNRTKLFKYALLFGEYNMYSFKGLKEGFPPKKSPAVKGG